MNSGWVIEKYGVVAGRIDGIVIRTVRHRNDPFKQELTVEPVDFLSVTRLF